METGAGILVPGSRFLPFYNPVLLPSELRFFSKGKELERTILDCTPEEMYGYYWLFGEEFVPQYLSLDSEENDAPVRRGGFRGYRRAWRFGLSHGRVSTGSGLRRVRPRPRRGSRIGTTDASKLVPLSPDQNDLAWGREWLEVFESSLLHSIRDRRASASIEEQLAFAFFLGRIACSLPHAATVDEFISWTRRSGSSPTASRPGFGASGRDPPIRELWEWRRRTAPRFCPRDGFSALGSSSIRGGVR
jgi:hypothetical protein